MDVTALLDWYDAGHRPLPWRATTDPWAILVSEVMCQQTQAPRVVAFYERFIERWPTPAGCAEAEVADLLAVWRGLGYPRRALALREAARAIAATGWPDDLTELPGVGPYTAAAVGSFAFGRAVAVVDTNVRRLLERHDGVARGPRALQARADELLPDRPATFNQAVMEHGATICTPRRPRCGDCPIRHGCAAHTAGGVVERPRRRPTAAAVRFTDTDRHARGQILRALLDGTDPASGLPAERFDRLADDLVREGFARRDPESGRLQL